MNQIPLPHMFNRRKFLLASGLVLGGSCLCRGNLLAWVDRNGSNGDFILNPTSFDFKNELVRPKLAFPNVPGIFMVRNATAEVPYQVEVTEGGKQIWICADFPVGSKQTFQIVPGSPTFFPPKVSLQKGTDYFTLNNGKVAVRVPTHSTGNIPGPIHSIQLANGQYAGRSFWRTNKKLKNYTVEVVGDGTLFAKLRLHYEFVSAEGSAKKVLPFAEFEIVLAPEWEHVSIFERHEMDSDDFWEFVMSDGWSPDSGISRQFNNGPGGDGIIVVPPMDRPLLPIKNVCFSDDLYINLIPRWNQHFKDGWAFAATDGKQNLCAVAIKASQWKWPHDNHLQCVVNPDGKYAGVRCSTWRGQRLWWLAPSLSPSDPKYIARNVWENLDKINHDYVLEWPGKTVGWWSTNPYDSEQTNPTHTIRQIGKSALKNAGQPADETTLIRFQTLIHRDCFGSYWDQFSPENPNFFTDYNLIPIALASNLKAHPQFETFRKLTENKFREDLYHSITLPGGAGQECPGYSHYGMSLWHEIVAMGKQHLGFDMNFITPRLEASERFYQRISYPDGDIRRCSPVGDSHPDRAGNTGMPKVEVDATVVKTWKTEEMPGFGVLFANHPGTEKETYLSFKSGPNRCHYHGDQLAFHYCANGRPLVVDHHCSYHPRAGQEHMHNRLAFFTDEFPYANMDGYEKVIAVKTTDNADLAIGQVESNRIRAVESLPPEAWDASYPQLKFNKPLVYRRTIVLMKNGDQDYFVFRDQYWADRPMKAAFCLHTYGSTPSWEGQIISFGNLSLYCTHPAFTMRNFDWSHENGGHEETKGARLEISGQTGEMITVMYPGIHPPEMKIVNGGVQVGDDRLIFNGNKSDFEDSGEIVRVTRSGKIILSLNGNEMDPDRPQGEIGLFVPDAGYPFGDIPEWLAKQRTGKPEWANEI
jgi:hypothetical protein